MTNARQALYVEYDPDARPEPVVEPEASLNDSDVIEVIKRAIEVRRRLLVGEDPFDLAEYDAFSPKRRRLSYVLALVRITEATCTPRDKLPISIEIGPLT